jgi:predicted secreted protein
MDALLLRTGFLPLWLLVAAASAFSRGEDGALWRGACWAVVAVLLPLALRAAALRGDRERGGRPPPPAPAFVRRAVVRLRWPLAVLWAGLHGLVAYAEHDRLWLTAVTAAAAGAAAAYAARTLPDPAG